MRMYHQAGFSCQRMRSSEERATCTWEQVEWEGWCPLAVVRGDNLPERCRVTCTWEQVEWEGWRPLALGRGDRLQACHCNTLLLLPTSLLQMKDCLACKGNCWNATKIRFNTTLWNTIKQIATIPRQHFLPFQKIMKIDKDIHAQHLRWSRLRVDTWAECCTIKHVTSHDLSSWFT